MSNIKFEIKPYVMPSIDPRYPERIDHWRQASEKDENLAYILPPKPSVNGKPRTFSRLQAAIFGCASTMVDAGFKTPLAAKMARRVMEAHLREPEVPQWALVHTANGNVATLPYNQTELRTGFISGSRFTFGIVIDLQTFFDRVDEAIADAPCVIGGEDV